MKKINILATLVVGTLVMLFTGIIVSADGGEFELERACKSENAECFINSSGHNCCVGLLCVPFNGVSGNGKCQKPASPTPTPTNTPTNTPTETPVMCEPRITIGDCDYELIEN